MPKNIIVYSTRSCPHCARAKDFLKTKGIAFKEVDLTDNAGKRREVQERYGWMTVPMIVIGDQFIGGADELYELERTGKLTSLIG